MLNGGFAIGLFISNLLGFIVPLDHGDKGDVLKMIEDERWRIVFSAPILLSIISIICLLCFIKEVSIISLLDKEDADSQVLQDELKKIYILKGSMTYKKLAMKLKKEIKIKEGNPTGVIYAFRSK